jgi:signal transduction histidine kinase
MPPDISGRPDPLARFAGHVAHDLNNFLTAILGNLELLQNRVRRGDVSELDDLVESANRAGHRAAQLVYRLTVFSGGDNREPSRQYLGELIKGLEEHARAGGINASFRLADEDALLLCDPARTDLALVELLNNAAAATAAGGEIFVEASAPDGQIVICVRDTGYGMAPETLARAGEVFFTTHPSRAGKGLGLPIVARFAAETGGRMEIESELGRGCRVTLILPRAEA